MSVENYPVLKPSYKEYDTQFNRALNNCLYPLLKALHWEGSEEHVKSALPYMTGISGLGSFTKTMENLSFDQQIFNIKIQDLSENFIPCLFITSKDEPWVFLSKENEQCCIWDGGSQKKITLENASVKGKAYFFKSSSNTSSDFSYSIKKPFLKMMARPYRGVLLEAIMVTFVIAVLALIIPLFARAVFDEVIPARSSHILLYFLFGIIVAIFISAVLSFLISKSLVLAGSKFSEKVNNKVFNRILHLSPSYTENATVNAQVSRIKDFDSIREFIIGPVFRLFFEFIFIILAICFIAYLGGNLVFIPLTSIVLYLFFYFIFENIVRDAVSLSARFSTERQDFMLETLSSLRALKYCHAEQTWFNRYRAMSAEAAIKNFHASELNSAINGFLDFIMFGTGFCMVVFGALKVISGQLTFGTLLALTIISWRLVTPLKGIFGAQARIQQFCASVKQINTLMTIAPERDSSALLHRIDSLKGDIVFHRVGFRYPNASDFSLSGINFSIKKGELVAIVGPMGSGKSTIIKLILGLYYPQAGNILLDGVDIRQYDVMNLRYSLGYVSQSNSIFFGTVAQNLFLANPLATKEQLIWSARRADVLNEILSMPKGFDTPITDNSAIQLSPGFQQRLALARTYLKKSSIVLLDEPVTSLDEEGSNAFCRAIEYFKGHATILLVTHRPSHLKMADQILVLNRGQMILSGNSDKISDKIPKELI